ncbi:hypothetical protein HIM_09388 [Hirsutella minnesotensis 3608]|uniref:DUF676 domain-containing protein n=1 Tax=Hirsutella minnesotensis 3608 TaxID=1043627 RepID=A0A0F7ZLL9_9HYPO|nr:hypothetical protein HIM_09388 [Hirsutella minnesotensis 3608]
MLYIHQVGSVKVGEVVRYTITYTPSKDTLPPPDKFHVRIRNTEAVALRAAIIPGPYLLSVCAYPTVYDPFKKLENPEVYGVPQFEPQVKAGSSWEGDLLIPRHVSQAVSSSSHYFSDEGKDAKSVSWVIEIISQTVFAKSASVGYDVSVSSNTQYLETSISNLLSVSNRRPGKLEDHQRHMRETGSPSPLLNSGVFSEAISLKVEDTAMLWSSPSLVNADHQKPSQRYNNDTNGNASPKAKQKKVHLVILTHGLQCNLTADMLFLKETIDAAARQARQDGSAADDEEIIVRGYSGNATRTQRGVKFLGSRVAKYVLSMTYPDQPCLPSGRTAQDGFPQGIAGDHHRHHHYPHSYASHEYRDEQRLSYKITSISFIGHSLGGPTQTFALAYIQKHSPTFFELIKPRNFITIASPLMGIGAESAPYVRLALETGLVGLTGRDLGLSWGLNTVVRNRWTAFNRSRGQIPNSGEKELATEPLLRILPSGLAHAALKKFENRTVYANTVNDGIVPLRTSSLLFLDWQSLEKVERYQRDANFIESIAVRAWREMKGKNSVTTSHREWKAPDPISKDEIYLHNNPSNTFSHTDSGLTSSAIIDVNANEPISEKYVSRRHKQMITKCQTLRIDESTTSLESIKGLGVSQGRSATFPVNNEIYAPPETSFFEWVGDMMNSAAPNLTHILDPNTRPKTILHDRVYQPADIPPLEDDTNVRVEEKIARSYHCDMSWRKVLVKLEPDAHISICVRRMFPDSQGWPVFKHIVDSHFNGAGSAAQARGVPSKSNADINLLFDNEINPGAKKQQESDMLDGKDDDSDDDNKFRSLARTGRQFKASTWYAGKRLL